MKSTPVEEWSGFRERCRRIIFHSDEPSEKIFDILLIVAILASVLVVMMESVEAIRVGHEEFLRGCEWFFTGLFTIEYVLRLYVSKKPLRYAGSFFGIVDLLAILPTYLSLLLPGAQYFALLRTIRVLRVFRVLKMAQYVKEMNLLLRAIRGSARKITVFIFGVLTLVTILGSVMYLIEGPERGFTSIPKSIYWAIVTLTTVGYGDMTPATPLGQAVASVIMIVGYGIIAVPTGIVTAEITLASRAERDEKECGSCGAKGHDADSKFCRKCGGELG